VVIAGGHGKIALLVERLLAERGDQAVGLIRNPDHAAEVHKAGAEAVVCDLETAAAEDVCGLVAEADAVVFVAGAGPGSGAARKDTVDRAAAVLMASAAERARSSAPTSPLSSPPCSTTQGPGTGLLS
jgi:nucleoside-diphosphate-sugar epimerase